MNKHVVKEIDDFLIRENTGSIKKTQFGTEMNLFQHIEEVKKVNGYLRGKGLDPFKRGTKMPKLITEALVHARWEVVKDSPEVGISMWD